MVDGLLTVFPEGYIDDPLRRRSCSTSGERPSRPAAARPISRWSRAPTASSAFSKICTHAGCAVSLFNVLIHAAHLPLPPVDFQHPPGLLHRCSARPPGPCPSCPCSCDARRLPDRPQRLHRARRARLLEQVGRLSDEHRWPSGRRPASGRKLEQTGTGLGGRPPGLVEMAPLGAGQDLPGPLVVHGRRDRHVLLRHPAGHGHLPGAVLQRLQCRRRVPRALQGSGRPVHDRGLRLGHQHLVQRAGRVW